MPECVQGPGGGGANGGLRRGALQGPCRVRGGFPPGAARVVPPSGWPFPAFRCSLPLRRNCSCPKRPSVTFGVLADCDTGRGRGGPQGPARNTKRAGAGAGGRAEHPCSSIHAQVQLCSAIQKRRLRNGNPILPLLSPSTPPCCCCLLLAPSAPPHLRTAQGDAAAARQWRGHPAIAAGGAAAAAGQANRSDEQQQSGEEEQGTLQAQAPPGPPATDLEAPGLRRMGHGKHKQDGNCCPQPRHVAGHEALRTRRVRSLGVLDWCAGGGGVRSLCGWKW